jgi:hypothetical protein
MDPGPGDRRAETMEREQSFTVADNFPQCAADWTFAGEVGQVFHTKWSTVVTVTHNDGATVKWDQWSSVTGTVHWTASTAQAAWEARTSGWQDFNEWWDGGRK